MKKKVFELLALAAASLAHPRHGRQKVSIPECDLTGTLEERFTITLLPVFVSVVRTSRVITCKSSSKISNMKKDQYVQHFTGDIWSQIFYFLLNYICVITLVTLQIKCCIRADRQRKKRRGGYVQQHRLKPAAGSTQRLKTGFPAFHNWWQVNKPSSEQTGRIGLLAPVQF